MAFHSSATGKGACGGELKEPSQKERNLADEPGGEPPFELSLKRLSA